MNLSSGSRVRSAARSTAIATTVAVLMGGVLVSVPANAADAVAEPVTLINTASTTWNYLEDNTDPAAGSSDRNSWTTTDFADTAWKSAKGSFGAKNGVATGIGGGYTANTLLKQYITGTAAPTTPTFFFRTDFELTTAQLGSIDGLAADVMHDDALVVFVNGQKVAGVDDTLVTKNLQYAGVSASDPKEANFRVATDVLHAGTNTVAVALYQDRDSSSDIYLDFKSLTTVPTVEDAPASITDLVLNIGADETKRNLAWYSDSGVAETAQVAKKSDVVGDTFPANKAASFTAASGATTEGISQYEHADVSGLVEDTRYVYRVGSDARGWSDTYEFVTQKFSGDYNFLFIGDAQIGAGGDVAKDQAGWTSTLNSAETKFPNSEFIFSAGDQVEHAANETEYAAFLAPEQLRRLPLVTIDGNHDVGSKAYEQHYNMPNWDPAYGAASSPTSSGGDYWFSYNDVLYMSLDSNSRDYASHNAFLKKVVAEHGDDFKWKVVAFHHSVYSVAAHANDTDIIERRANMPTILSNLDVDLVLMGHDHVYTRSFLMNKGVVAETSKVASPVVTAQDGDVLYVTANSSSGSKYYDIQAQSYDFAAVTNQEKVRNFSNIQVKNNSLTVTTYRSDDLTKVDEVTLKQADVVKPEITVPATAEIAIDSTFDAMEGVSASDDVDGDLTSAVTVSGTVDTTKVGSYELIYTVADAAGNSTSVTRTVAVTAGTLVTTVPKITGTVRAGKTVTATVATWSPAAEFAYQWSANGTPISGATGKTLALTSTLASKKISVAVTGTRSGYATATAESAAVTVAKGVFSAAKPKLSGSAKVGKTLKVVVGSWSPKASYTYKWYVGGKAVSGSKKSLSITKKMKGKTIKVRVTGTHSGYTTMSIYSSSTVKVKK